MQTSNRNKNQRKLSKKQISQILSSLSLDQSLNEDKLLIETCDIDVQKIVRVIEVFLQDRIIYRTKPLKQLLLSTKNGWFSIPQLLKIKILQKKLSEIQLFNMIDIKTLMSFIKTQVKRNPQTSLVMNKFFIKRKIPFQNRIKDVKPIYIENYPEEKKMTTITQMIGGVTQIYKSKFNVGDRWCYMFVAEPQKALEYLNHLGESEIATEYIQPPNAVYYLNVPKQPFKAYSFEEIKIKIQNSLGQNSYWYKLKKLYQSFHLKLMQNTKRERRRHQQKMSGGRQTKYERIKHYMLRQNQYRHGRQQYSSQLELQSNENESRNRQKEIYRNTNTKDNQKGKSKGNSNENQGDIDFKYHDDDKHDEGRHRDFPKNDDPFQKNELSSRQASMQRLLQDQQLKKLYLYESQKIKERIRQRENFRHHPTSNDHEYMNDQALALALYRPNLQTNSKLLLSNETLTKTYSQPEEQRLSHQNEEAIQKTLQDWLDNFAIKQFSKPQPNKNGKSMSFDKVNETADQLQI